MKPNDISNFLVPNISLDPTVTLAGSKAQQFNAGVQQQGTLNQQAYGIEYQVPYAIRFDTPVVITDPANGIGVPDVVGNGTGSGPGSNVFVGPPGPPGEPGQSSSPGGANGDIQINASGILGTIGGLTLDQTGNARGLNALDIQTKRSAVTQVASNQGAVTIGLKNTASGYYATAVGTLNTASGYNAVVGYQNTGSAYYASAFGAKNTASGYNSIAVGYSNIANATSSVSIGKSNTASNTNAVAVGTSNTSSGSSSAVFGNGSSATASDSVSIGNGLSNSTAGSLLIGSNNASSFIQLDNNRNFGFRGSSYGGGSGVLFIANAVTAPTTNPSGGGILYVTGGALTYRGSSGTVTTVAPA